jgi:hypothetical protein
VLAHIRRAGADEDPRLFEVDFHDTLLMAAMTCATNSRSLPEYTVTRIS